MPRGNPSGVRSGRINSPPANNPIIVTKKDTPYRFSNTGKTAFVVKYTVDTTDTTVDVKKNCSVDLKVAEDVKVVVTGTSATGVFDLLQAGKPARGGKFKGNGEIVIAKRREGEIYRVFNGGDNAFRTVPAPTTAALADIPVRSSRDVLVMTDEFKIADAGARVAGAFDTISSADIRSGRFVFTSGMGADKWDYLIVDLSAGTVPKQTYRITNTGDESFQVVLGATVVSTLATDQSVDVQLGSGTANSVLKVRAVADSKTLTGIYDNI